MTSAPTTAAQNDTTAANSRATVVQCRRVSVAASAPPPPLPTPPDAGRAGQKRPSWTNLLGAQQNFRGVAITVNCGARALPSVDDREMFLTLPSRYGWPHNVGAAVAFGNQSTRRKYKPDQVPALYALQGTW